MTNAVQTISARDMVLKFQKAVEEKSVQGFADCFAEDGVMEFPYTYPGEPHRIAGRDAICEIVTAHWGDNPVLPDRYDNFAWYETTKPGQVIVEFSLPGRKLNGDVWVQQALLILEVEDGRIKLFREYLNPVDLASSTDRLDEFAADAKKVAGTESDLAVH